jgi:Uma2 family endonuclease
MPYVAPTPEDLERPEGVSWSPRACGADLGRNRYGKPQRNRFWSFCGAVSAYPGSPMMLESSRVLAGGEWNREALVPSDSEETRGAIMATATNRRQTRKVDYPSGDGKPMAETELHMEDMIDTIQVLKDYYAGQPNVYVGGNLLLYYEEGNRRKHVAPDVLVALRVPKEPKRDHYLVWDEGKAPDFVAEITSKSTKREDEKKKFEIYRDILRVSEYFLFDPTEDYLDPPLQGFRLSRGKYVRIKEMDGRVPSRVLGLHLERHGTKLRLFDPVTGAWLPTRSERAETADRRAETAEHRAEAADRRAEAAEAARRRDSEEMERLRREIAALRRG